MRVGAGSREVGGHSSPNSASAAQLTGRALGAASCPPGCRQVVALAALGAHAWRGAALAAGWGAAAGAEQSSAAAPGAASMDTHGPSSSPVAHAALQALPARQQVPAGVVPRRGRTALGAAPVGGAGRAPLDLAGTAAPDGVQVQPALAGGAHRGAGGALGAALRSRGAGPAGAVFGQAGAWCTPRAGQVGAARLARRAAAALRGGRGDARKRQCRMQAASSSDACIPSLFSLSLWPTRLLACALDQHKPVAAGGAAAAGAVAGQAARGAGVGGAGRAGAVGCVEEHRRVVAVSAFVRHRCRQEVDAGQAGGLQSRTARAAQRVGAGLHGTGIKV